MYLCTCVTEEGDDGESAHSETPSLLSYTLRYVSFTEVGIIYRVSLWEPIHLCTCVNEEGDDGEDERSKTSSLLSYTLRCVSFAEVGSVCRVALREPMHLCTCVSEEGGDGESAFRIVLRSVSFLFAAEWIKKGEFLASFFFLLLSQGDGDYQLPAIECG